MDITAYKQLLLKMLFCKIFEAKYNNLLRAFGYRNICNLKVVNSIPFGNLECPQVAMYQTSNRGNLRIFKFSYAHTCNKKAWFVPLCINYVPSSFLFAVQIAICTNNDR